VSLVAIYGASHDDYDELVLFTGLPVGTCQDALTPDELTVSPTKSRITPHSGVRALAERCTRCGRVGSALRGAAMRGDGGQ
jgi:hypothetical protein